jgi:hypothetical protein
MTRSETSRRVRRGRTLRGVCVPFLLGLAACSSSPTEVTPTHEHPGAAQAPTETTRRVPDVLDAPQVRRLSDTGWVEVRAAVLGSDDEAPAAARSRAVAHARRAAVEHVAGVNVRSSLLSLDQIRDGSEGSLLQVLSTSRADALVLDEKLESSRVSTLPSGGYRVDVTLRAQVLDHRANGDDGFRTEVRLNRKMFRDGEDVDLSVRSSEPARLYVMAVSDGGAVMLLPSRHMPETTVEADAWLHFPDARLKERGVHLRAQLPDGEMHAEEALIVIALRGGRRLRSPVPASGSSYATASRGEAGAMLSDLLAPLLHVPASDWTFDQLVYAIQPR